MSVNVLGAGGARKSFPDDAKVSYSYHVTPSGVLLLMEQLNGDPEWTVKTEFSPAGWWEVSGLRFLIDPKKAEGREGKVEESSQQLL